MCTVKLFNIYPATYAENNVLYFINMSIELNEEADIALILTFTRKEKKTCSLLRSIVTPES